MRRKELTTDFLKHAGQSWDTRYECHLLLPFPGISCRLVQQFRSWQRAFQASVPPPVPLSTERPALPPYRKHLPLFWPLDLAQHCLLDQYGLNQFTLRPESRH